MSEKELKQNVEQETNDTTQLEEDQIENVAGGSFHLRSTTTPRRKSTPHIVVVRPGEDDDPEEEDGY